MSDPASSPTPNLAPATDAEPAKAVEQPSAPPLEPVAEPPPALSSKSLADPALEVHLGENDRQTVTRYANGVSIQNHQSAVAAQEYIDSFK